MIIKLDKGNTNISSKKNIINRDAKVPHVPGANLIYPTQKSDKKILVKFFI